MPAVPRHVHAFTDIIGGNGAGGAGGSGSVAVERAQRIAADEALDAKKVNRVGDDYVTGTLTVGSSKVVDQAGTGTRLVAAGPDGTQEAIPRLSWDGKTLTVDADNLVSLRLKQPTGGSYAINNTRRPNPIYYMGFFAFNAEFNGSQWIRVIDGDGVGGGVDYPALLGFSPTGGFGMVVGASGTNGSTVSAFDSVFQFNRAGNTLGTDPGGSEFLRIGGSLQAASLRAIDQSGDTVRLVATDTTGKQSAPPELQWQSGSGYKRIATISALNEFVGTNTICTGTGGAATAAHQAVGADNEFAIQAAWCSGNEQVIGGVSAAEGVGFIGYNTDKIFYGSHVSGTGVTVYFAYNTGISAKYDTNGWTFAQRIKVTADAGVGQRMLTAAAADGAHTPVASVVWDGSALVLGTDPGGSDLLRVGGAATINGNARLLGLTLMGATTGKRIEFTPASGVMEFFDRGTSAYFPGRYIAASHSFEQGAVTIGTDPGGSELLRVGGSVRCGADVIAGGAFYATQNSSNGQAQFIGSNLEDSTYFTISAYGSNGYGIPVWQKSVSFEAVPAAGGNLVLGAYTGDIVLQVNYRTTTALRAKQDGSIVVGTDPGGSELLRVGGSIRVADTVSVSDKVRMHYDASTGERGMQVKLINKTGAATVKGTICSTTTTDMAFALSPGDAYDPAFIVYEAGVADGTEAWVWCIGSVCEVLLKDGTAATRDYWAKLSDTAGRADITNASPPGGTITALEDHGREVGHALESKTSGTSVLCRITFHLN